MPGRRKQAVRALAFFFVLVLLGPAAWFLPVGDWLADSVEWIEARGAAGVMLFAGGYVLGTLLFVPGALLTIAAGIVYGPWWGGLLSLVCATIGATLAFLVARHLARGIVGRWVAKRESFRALDAAIGKEDWKAVALLRLSPLVPFNVSNYAFGVTRARLSAYVLASFVGMAPGSLLYAWLGHIGAVGLEGREAPPSTPEIVFLAAGLIATAAVTWLLARMARKELKQA